MNKLSENELKSIILLNKAVVFYKHIRTTEEILNMLKFGIDSLIEPKNKDLVYIDESIHFVPQIVIEPDISEAINMFVTLGESI